MDVKGETSRCWRHRIKGCRLLRVLGNVWEEMTVGPIPVK